MPDIYQQRIVSGRPEDVVRMINDPGEWLKEAASHAGHFGQAAEGRLRSQVGLSALRSQVSKRVHLEVGKAYTVRGHYVVPLTWEASGLAGLFPVMQALIEVHRRGRDQSQIVFWGRYDPPLGRAGELIDKYVAHEVAEVTVQHLLAAIEEQTRSHVSAGTAA